MKTLLPVVAAAVLCTAPAARASVASVEGVEVEGVHDRRGLFLRPGLAFGAVMPRDRTIPQARLTLGIGAGLGRDTTIGVEGGLGVLFGDEGGPGPVADVELTQFFGAGTFVRLGLGLGPTSTATGAAGGVTYTKRTGFGGRLGLGHEVWTGSAQAFGIALSYDGRVDTEQRLVSGVVASAYLAFY